MLAQLIEAHDMLAHDMLAQLIELHDAEAHDMLDQSEVFHVGSAMAVARHFAESNWRTPEIGSATTNRFKPSLGSAVPAVVAAVLA